MTIKTAILQILLVFLLASGCATDPERDAKEAARIAAIEWIYLLDDGRYNECWQSSATHFKQALSSEEWEETISDIRSPLGPVMGRTELSADYSDPPMEGPDGKYLTIQYRTDFQKRIKTMESITLIMEENKKWRVYTYSSRLLPPKKRYR
ncbi:DUF4019 domain-containing protein [bacterium]|nr:DUF4019 domain-containing protein [bacterium]